MYGLVGVVKHHFHNVAFALAALFRLYVDAVSKKYIMASLVRLEYSNHHVYELV